MRTVSTLTLTMALLLASLAGWAQTNVTATNNFDLTQFLTNSAGATYYVDREVVVNVAGTWRSDQKAGGVQVGSTFYFTKLGPLQLGLEGASGWTSGAGAFNNAQFGLNLRIPLKKFPRLAPYLKAGGLYDAEDVNWSQTTTSTHLVNVGGLPCQAGDPGAHLQTTTTTTTGTYGKWGGYVGGGLAYALGERGLWRLYAEATYEIMDGPNRTLVAFGVQRKL